MASSSIQMENPYASNPAFSSLESQVLWEYAKLSKHLKTLKNLKNQPLQPHEQLLATLRNLEKQMGLVLTLYKASVWATIVDTEQEMNADREEEASRRYQQGLQEDGMSEGDRTVQEGDEFRPWGI
ncbi:DASH complex subunit Dad3-domain-containing protein [Mrakia frigida]|uniref:Dad3p n=1 Tax=Mrakia frigida TaxID=29902 RepID=UPI003FCC000D